MPAMPASSQQHTCRGVQMLPRCKVEAKAKAATAQAQENDGGSGHNPLNKQQDHADPSIDIPKLPSLGSSENTLELL
jgi:hypothetical protein